MKPSLYHTFIALSYNVFIYIYKPAHNEGQKLEKELFV